MSYNILLVDDSDVTRAIIAKTLRLAQVPLGELHEAANGKEALEVLGDNWIDLVFADLNMPVMDGVEMIERMHRDGLLSTVPVVVVSTESSPARIGELRTKGVRAYVRKPFTPELIREHVEDILGAGKPRQEPALAALLEVLEAAAFLFGDPVDCCGVDLPEEPLLARVDVSGPLVGRVELALPAPLATTLVGNMLGLEDGAEVTDGAAADALGELVNVLAGRIVAGRTVLPVRLSSPDVASATPEGWRELASRSGTVTVEVEGQLVVLHAEIEEPEA